MKTWNKITDDFYRTQTDHAVQFGTKNGYPHYEHGRVEAKIEKDIDLNLKGWFLSVYVNGLRKVYPARTKKAAHDKLMYYMKTKYVDPDIALGHHTSCR
jgi:hypothetical protein